MSIPSVLDLKIVKKSTQSLVEAELATTGGLLRLAPAWVPRSFLQPGLRIKLHPDDTYAYGLNRGGIDERWFASTTVTANEGRAADEGLSYVVIGNRRLTLAQAVEDTGATRPRASASTGGTRKDRPTVGLHFVRLLLDFVPELLVERRSLPRSRGLAGSVSMDHRQPRRCDG